MHKLINILQAMKGFFKTLLLKAVLILFSAKNAEEVRLRLRMSNLKIRLIFFPLKKSEGLRLRKLIRYTAGLSVSSFNQETQEELVEEIQFLRTHHEYLQPLFSSIKDKRVLFAGQAYYNAWYLSRSLRTLGWKADVLNWDQSSASQIYYHGQDFLFDSIYPFDLVRDLRFYVEALYQYDLFHFSNKSGICFGFFIQHFFTENFGKHSEIYLLKSLGKKIIYSNNGCLDGVSQTAFSKWGPESVCSICIWRDTPSVCSDELNLNWGKFRNEVADYQCTLGGNRADYNVAPTVHEAPEFYCLDQKLWDSNLVIPEKYKLSLKKEGVIRLYHAVGNKNDRTDKQGVNIKSSHVYGPLIEKLKNEGFEIETLEPTGIPNKEVRYMQAQADIFLEMLTYGWFGANAREAMMLGKPVICFIRPEWLDDVRREIPDYANELPIISATPATIECVLRDLILHPEKREEIGRKSREFAIKWHSSESGAKRFDEIYSKLLNGNPLLLDFYLHKIDKK